MVIMPMSTLLIGFRCGSFAGQLNVVQYSVPRFIGLFVACPVQVGLVEGNEYLNTCDPRVIKDV